MTRSYESNAPREKGADLWLEIGRLIVRMAAENWDRGYPRIQGALDIHFRFDQEAGAEQGRRLGAYLYKHSLGHARNCPCRDEEEEK